MFRTETEWGSIRFSKQIINKIVAEAVEGCKWNVNILNYKGKYKNMVPGIASKINLYDEESGGIEITESDEGIEIAVFIVVPLGGSIKQITDHIIDYIYEYVEKMFGEAPKKVTVAVTGIASKNIVKRNIIISR